MVRFKGKSAVRGNRKSNEKLSTDDKKKRKRKSHIFLSGEFLEERYHSQNQGVVRSSAYGVNKFRRKESESGKKMREGRKVCVRLCFVLFCFRGGGG